VAVARDTLPRALADLVGAEHVLAGGEIDRRYLHDATESWGAAGEASAVVLPGTAAQVADVLGWCYANDVPIVPRGGGTGYAGGAIPQDGAVVLSLERLTRVRALDPLAWRMHVEAGMTTRDVQRLARESGLRFPPDPGASEQSQIGGNVATNAGGPHAFRYGQTGAFVLGLEVALAPGELVQLGGPVRKDVAGYDLLHLLVGSEGTLGIVTAVWLRLIPQHEAAFPLIGFYRDVAGGCAAIEALLASGVVPAAIEYLDGASFALARGSFPWEIPGTPGMVVIAEAEGTQAEARAARKALREALADGALGVVAPLEAGDVAALWRWRVGVSQAIMTRRGGKLGEDVAVPLDRLGEAIEETLEIGARHGLETCSFGHAGDGNLHSTFLVDPGEPEEVARAERAAAEIFTLAVRLGGTVSGEHGIGMFKNGQLRRQWAPRAVELHGAVKRVFDPKGLLNPGKKLP
jgi:glycolate oxidase subunit GlcD